MPPCAVEFLGLLLWMYERAGECAERCPSLQLSAADLSAAKTVRRAAEGQRPAPLQPDRGSNRTRGPRCCPHLASPAPATPLHPPTTHSERRPATKSSHKGHLFFKFTCSCVWLRRPRSARGGPQGGILVSIRFQVNTGLVSLIRY